MKRAWLFFTAYYTLASLFFMILASTAHARDRDRDFKRGRGGNHRGNERSERVAELAVGEPVYGGNGCPQGTMRVVFAPDYLSFSILFDQFVAEVGESKQKRDVMNCDALIPMQIPRGLQMEITRVDFRGFVGLPDRATAALHSIFNFRGERGDGDRMNLRFRFAGPVMDNYEISTDVLNQNGRAQDSEVSPCGGPVNLRIMNQVRIATKARGETASVTIDSIDGSSNAIYHVNWKACRR